MHAASSDHSQPPAPGTALRKRARDAAPSHARAVVLGLLPIAGALTIALLCQFGLTRLLGPFAQNMLVHVAVAIVLAVSLNIVTGFTGQFSIGHAGFVAIGGYVGAATTYYGSAKLFSTSAIHGGLFGSGDWLFVAGCLLGGTAAAVAGLFVGLPSLRLRGDYLALVTLGFGEIVRSVLQLSGKVIDDVQTAQQTGILKLFASLGGALGFNLIPQYSTPFWAWAFASITLLVAYRIKESTYGLAMLSIRENPVAAEAMGVPVTRYKVLAFVVSAFFAGVGGSLYAHDIGILNPDDLGFQRSFDIVIMVVLGGMGSISGAVLAAVALTLLPEMLRGLSEYRMIIYALTLIILMIVRPQGLFGLREVWQWRPVALLLGKGRGR